MGNYKILETTEQNGSTFCPAGSWDESFFRIISDARISSIKLTNSFGWRGTDIDFVKRLPELTSLQVYTHDIVDISAAAMLSELHTLGLRCKPKSRLDFSKLRKLEVADLIWNKHLDGVLSCQKIKHINFSRWPYQDITPLSSMVELEELLLSSTKLTSLDGIERLRRIYWAQLFACPQLQSISALDSTMPIERLDFDSCKRLRDISAVSGLEKLRWFFIDSCSEIESLSPVVGCKNLEYVSFLGNTKIVDGDMEPLTKLPKLQKLRFAGRRNYNLNRTDILPKNTNLAWPSRPSPGE